jgi:hypothetical protein
MVTEKRMMRGICGSKRVKVKGKEKKFRIDVFHNLWAYFSLNIIRTIK